MLCLAAPGTALANDAYEPNENPYKAYGPIAAGQNYAAVLPTAGDEDAFSFRSTGGQVTIDTTVTRDGCADTENAIAYSIWEKEADGDWRPRPGDYGYVATAGSTSYSFNLSPAGDYAVLFSSPLNDDTSCGDTSVEYNFTATGSIDSTPSGGGGGGTGGGGGDTGGGGGTGGGDTGGGGSTGGGGTGGGGTGGGTTSPKGPKRLKSRPAFRKYACLHRSSGYTGFADPPFKFTLKRGGVWVDRSMKSQITARWKWRKRKLTLYSRSGRKLHTFAHFRDSSGKYLRQHPVPNNNNPLICR